MDSDGLFFYNIWKLVATVVSLLIFCISVCNTYDCYTNLLISRVFAQTAIDGLKIVFH